jgi:Tfp pilus assembly protein PilF
MLLLVAVVIVAYSPALRGGFVWDDEMYIVFNDSLRSASGLREIWTGHAAAVQQLGAGSDAEAHPRLKYNDYPLALTVYWIEYQLFGLHPFAYHLTNVLLHLVNVLLLDGLMQQLRVAGALLIAALFALHPLHVESVAWVAELKTLLCSAFAFAAIMLWVRQMQSGRWSEYAAALIAALLAMFSKSSMVTLPGVLFVVSWWQTPHLWRRALRRLLPLLCASAVVALLTVLREHRGASFVYGAEGHPLARLLIAGRALWFYAGKLLVPYPLLVIYPRWQIDRGAVWQYAFPLAALACLAFLWLRRRQLGRGPFSAVAIYIIALLPALGLVSFDFLRFSYVADHFAYPASAALITVGVAAVVGTRPSLPHRGIDQAAVAAVVAVLAWLTFAQAQTYQSAESFWSHTVRYNPAAPVASVNLAREMLLQGRGAETEALARAALVQEPNSVEARSLLGAALDLQKRLPEAEAEFRAALELAPQSAGAHFNLGLVLFRQKQWREAIAQLLLVPREDDKRLLVARHLGLAYRELGDRQNAVRYLEAALAIEPHDKPSRAALESILQDARRSE